MDAASAFPRALVALQEYVPAFSWETFLRNKEPFERKKELIGRVPFFVNHVTFGWGTP